MRDMYVMRSLGSTKSPRSPMPITLWPLPISRRLQNTTASIFRRAHGSISVLIHNAAEKRLPQKLPQRAKRARGLAEAEPL